MATQQSTGGVPLFIAHEPQHFRLLELPADMAELLDRPDCPLLYIKSQTPSATPSTLKPKPAYAVLCTSNQTFQLRQVQTSNSVLLTQPLQKTHGGDLPIPATCAIASCTTMLELQPSAVSASSLLRDKLPVYDIVAGDVDAQSNGIDKRSIFEDLPVSEDQCQAAWRELMAFEFNGSSYRPSPNALSQLWTSINTAALAEAVQLDAQFLRNDITKAVSDEGHPPNLVEAILGQLSRDDVDNESAWSCLDGRKTVTFVGLALLEAKTGDDFLIADFIDLWEDRLPNAWRKDAQLDTIEGLYEIVSGTTIRAISKQAAKAEAAVRPLAGKWHERLGKQAGDPPCPIARGEREVGWDKLKGILLDGLDEVIGQHRDDEVRQLLVLPTRRDDQQFSVKRL